MLHLARQTEYRRNYDAWVADRLLGIFYTVATGKLTEASRDNSMKSANKTRDMLYDLLSLYKMTHTAEEVQKQVDTNTGQRQYVELLAKDGGFKDLDTIMQAINGLNAVIRENTETADEEK